MNSQRSNIERKAFNGDRNHQPHPLGNLFSLKVGCELHQCQREHGVFAKNLRHPGPLKLRFGMTGPPTYIFSGGFLGCLRDRLKLSGCFVTGLKTGHKKKTRGKKGGSRKLILLVPSR